LVQAAFLVSLVCNILLPMSRSFCCFFGLVLVVTMHASRPEEQPKTVHRVSMLPPPWVRGEIEAPAGKKDMGSWVAAVYTEEQQARLGVNEWGEKVSTSKPSGENEPTTTPSGLTENFAKKLDSLRSRLHPRLMQRHEYGSQSLVRLPSKLAPDEAKNCFDFYDADNNGGLDFFEAVPLVQGLRNSMPVPVDLQKLVHTSMERAEEIHPQKHPEKTVVHTSMERAEEIPLQRHLEKTEVLTFSQNSMPIPVDPQKLVPTSMERAEEISPQKHPEKTAVLTFSQFNHWINILIRGDELFRY